MCLTLMYITFAIDGIKIFCHNLTRYTEKDVLETIILGIEDKRTSLENF